MSGKREGRHWAVQAEGGRSGPDYVSGDEHQTAEDAERHWREVSRIFFLGVTVRRTTPLEDERLAAGLLDQQ